MSEAIRMINQENVTNFLRGNFDKLGNTPWLWVIYGETLKTCAEILYKEYKLNIKSEDSNAKLGAQYILVVTFFIYALAIENVLKGLLISSDKTLIDKGNIDKKLKTHHLVSIAEKAGLAINMQEYKLLEILKKYIESLGRYPIPKNVSGFLTFRQAEEATDLLKINIVRNFFRKVKKELLNMY